MPGRTGGDVRRCRVRALLGDLPVAVVVHSRRESRDALKARGLIEPHAVRLGVTRWLWHPWRSPQVMWHATWAGENDPVKAIALTESAVRDAGTETTASASPVPSEPTPQDRRETVTPAVTVTAAKPSPRPSRQPSKRTSGRDRAAAIIKKDGMLTDAEVAKRAKVSESTATRARRDLTAAAPADPQARSEP